MSKSLTIIIILFFVISNIYGQYFGSSDSEWVYDYSGFPNIGITNIKFRKDTIIENRLTQLFDKQVYRVNRDNDSLFFNSAPICFYVENGVVEFSMDKLNFDTLYNFKARIGQSWMIYRHDRPRSDSIKVTILDTFRTMISNRNILTQQVEWTFHYAFGSSTFIDTAYEYIGTRWIYINPFDEKDRGIDDGEGGMLRCFKNNKLGVVEFYSEYQSDYEYDCDDLTSITTAQGNETLYTLSPNPVVDELIVKSEYSDRATLTIVDIMGRVVRLADILQGTNTMDVSGIPSGYYIVVINGTRVGKIVK